MRSNKLIDTHLIVWDGLALTTDPGLLAVSLLATVSLFSFIHYIILGDLEVYRAPFFYFLLSFLGSG